ncbi:acyltransferase family protein [Paenisporosarcina indica]|uniref:acyltransferase family protein n=1 Tax=Paenisporosarcina indica TaxID=650093 RepID=UPI000A068231|nr:acyltransferase [Paenisporosarcina indica]
MKVNNGSKRFEELDSLRGIIAFTVFVYHFFNVSWENRGQVGYWNIIAYSPLRILWAGHEAVIFFFILSGFVLSLPFYKKNYIHNYITFIIKRSLRIYFPFIVAVLLGIILRGVFSLNNIAGTWTGESGLNTIIKHILFIGTYNSNAFDSVIWSLVHEMRISLVFPLLIMLLIKFEWKKIMTLGFLTSVISIAFIVTLKIDNNINIIISFHYILMFIIGAILAKKSCSFS